MTTFKLCRTYDCHNQITKSATNAKHFVDIYLKSVGKQVQGDKLEAHFTTQPIDISCSKDVPMEHNEDVLQNMIMRRSHYMELPSEHCQHGIWRQPNLHNSQKLDYPAIFTLCGKYLLSRIILQEQSKSRKESI